MGTNTPETPAQAMYALCARLAQQRDALDAQLQALQAMACNLDGAINSDLLVALYVCMPSAKHVSDFATAQGWRLPGASGQPRALQPEDVFAAVRGRGGVLPLASIGALRDMAQAKLGGRGGLIPTR